MLSLLSVNTMSDMIQSTRISFSAACENDLIRRVPQEKVILYSYSSLAETFINIWFGMENSIDNEEVGLWPSGRKPMNKF